MINDNQKENILNLMQLCVQILPNVRGGDFSCSLVWYRALSWAEQQNCWCPLKGTRMLVTKEELNATSTNG